MKRSLSRNCSYKMLLLRCNTDKNYNEGNYTLGAKMKMKTNQEML